MALSTNITGAKHSAGLALRTGLALAVAASVVAGLTACGNGNGNGNAAPSAASSAVRTPTAPAVVTPTDTIGTRNDMTVFESSQVSTMYRSVPSNSIFNALIECSQSEIDTIRQVLKGYENPAVMTRILNAHGVETDAWLPDSPSSS